MRVGKMSCSVLSDGLQFRLLESPAAAVMHVRERFRPLRPIEALRESEVARLAPFIADISYDAVSYFVTTEGEYAALTSFRGSVKATQRSFVGFVGAVFADDWYQLIDAQCYDHAYVEPTGAAARELAYHSNLGLSNVRRRRFLYDVPPGWRGLARGLLTEWYPASYPALDAVITCASAWPRQDPTPPLLERIIIDGGMRDFFRDRLRGNVMVTSDHGLSGRRIEVAGKLPGKAERIIDQVAYRDDRFLYYLRLDCAQSFHQDVKPAFDAVVRSCQRIPHQNRDTHSQMLSQFDYLAE